MQKIKNKYYENFISKAKLIHHNKYDYSNTNPHIFKEKEKIEIICPIHGSFIQEIRVHLRGSGCRECSSDARRMSKEYFIKKAKEIHNSKYDYSLVKFINKNLRVEIICKKHGKFLQAPALHLSKHGCQQCVKDPDDFAIEFLKKAKEVHGNKYDYSLMNYTKSIKPITIICPIHGKFQQTPGGHLRSNGCYECSGRDKFNYETFITRAKKLHGDKYTYPENINGTQEESIKIICDIHGEFFQTPKNHMAGHGCVKCNRVRNISTEKFIQKAKDIHQNKYDYSSVKNNLENDREKVDIICYVHGKFSQEIRVHLRGSGCRECARKNLSLGKEKFIEKANKIHKNKYDYSKVDYQTNYLSVEIICPDHGKFLQSPNSHLRGSQCPGCAKSYEKKQEDFIKKSKKIHNNKYDYSFVKYVDVKTKVLIICPEHGEFYQKPKIHGSGFGCSKCSGSYELNNQYFIERAVKIHNNKYDYSKVDIKKSSIKVIIICPDHGDFLQTPANHLKGYGCIDCGGRKKIDAVKFIEKANKVHDGKYDYSKSIIDGSLKKIIIICPKHGEFEQTPSAHLVSLGCAKCALAINYSQNLWISSLNNESIITGYEKLTINGKKVRPDGYDPSTKTIYEFYGDYWHGNPEVFDPNEINPSVKKTFGELYRKTMEREELIKAAGYQVISIWESDFKKND